MDPGDFITFASRTVTQGKAGARSAISRAYYGAFHIVQEVLHELASELPRGASAHNLVPQYLQAVDHPTSNAVATLLSGLHSERIKADYQLSTTSVEATETAKLHVESAVASQQLIEAFRRDCLADPQLLQDLRQRGAGEIGA